MTFINEYVAQLPLWRNWSMAMRWSRGAKMCIRTKQHTEKKSILKNHSLNLPVKELILKTDSQSFWTFWNYLIFFLKANQCFTVIERKTVFSRNNCWFFFHFSEFRTYANIEITKQGYRHLIQDGYRYGETKVTDRCVYWRCTANIRDDNTLKSKRCVAQITTKIQNGYEMIRTTNVKHSHPIKETSRRRLI